MQIPTRFVVTCEFCGEQLDPGAEGVLQRMGGWVAQSGDDDIRLSDMRQPEPKIVGRMGIASSAPFLRGGERIEKAIRLCPPDKKTAPRGADLPIHVRRRKLGRGALCHH